MRTKPFTFTKTKTIKQKTEFRAISIDLTEQDAADLYALLRKVGGASTAREEVYSPLYRALLDFLGGGEVKPRVAFDSSIYSRNA